MTDVGQKKNGWSGNDIISLLAGCGRILRASEDDGGYFLCFFQVAAARYMCTKRILTRIEYIHKDELCPLE